MRKDFGLNRKEETKDINVEKILPDKKADDILNKFNLIIDDIESKFNLINILENKDMDEIIYNILRSQIMFLMSAVDYYVHEIVKYGIISIFKGERKRTKQYDTFSIGLANVEKAIKNIEDINWLEDAISNENIKYTFMAYEKIRRALLLISDDKKILPNAAKNINISDNKLKSNIDNIYKRRNAIAHQSDINESTGIKNKIDVKFVKDSIDFVKIAIESIHNEIVKGI